MSATVIPPVPLKSAAGLFANHADRNAKMSATVIPSAALKSARHVSTGAVVLER